MTEANVRRHQESVLVRASAKMLYDMVSDVTRTGDWSPVCRACWWDDEARAGSVGAWFTGRNELAHRTWQTRSQVHIANPNHEFSWIVGDGFVRWGFTFSPAETLTVLTEYWEFLPGGITMFEEKFGDQADAEITDRTEQAHIGIPATLAAIKLIAESRDDCRRNQT